MTKKEIIILSLLILIIISIITSTYIFLHKLDQINAKNEAGVAAAGQPSGGSGSGSGGGAGGAGPAEGAENPQLAELRNIHESLATEILRFTTEMNRHATDSPQYILLSSIIAEKQFLDLLILERVNALESNAEVNIVANQTRPNAELASQIASEIDTLTDANDEIKERLEADDQLNANINRLTYDSNLLTLSILNRNLMIAKYGLNVPSYPQSVQDIDVVTATNLLLGEKDKLDPARLAPGAGAGAEAAAPGPAPGPAADRGPGDEAGEGLSVGTQAAAGDRPAEDGEDGDLLTVRKLAATGRGYRLYGNWALSSAEHSGLGDLANVTILNLAPVRHSANFTKEQASMVIKCENGRTELSVIFRARIQSDYYRGARVEHAIDQNPPVTSFWKYSTNIQGVISNNPTALIAALLPAERVTFRVPRYDSTAVMETHFNLGGLSEAIVPLREACGW